MKPTHETPLVLASPAPRHAAMLAGAGVPGVRIRDGRWTRGTAESSDDVARRAALEAARAEDAVALGCAWTLSVGGATLDVPRDADDARRMLARITGQRATISAGWAIAGADGVRRSGHAEATLHLRAADGDALDRYATTGEAAACPGALDPLRSGMRFVDRCEGDWTAALGMPLSDVLDALTAEGLTPPPASPVARRAALLGGRIAAACAAADRPRSSVRLVGASKAQPLERLGDALQAGVRDLGESYVQEWQEKFSAFADTDPGPVWHYIGRVQRNKARPIGRMAQLVHGVYAVRTARALAKVALDEGNDPLPILIQVDLAGEESKGGAAPDTLESLLTDIADVDGVRVDGLMTLPPQEGLAGARARFAQLRTLRDALATPDRPLSILSMGMSGDFEAAIAEGATHVRVGTALFGPRPRA